MVLKLICFLEFNTDLKGTNYLPKNDFHLFDLAAVDNYNSQVDPNTASTSTYTPLAAISENDVNCMAAVPYKPLTVSEENDDWLVQL